MRNNFRGPLEDRVAIRELLDTYAEATYHADEAMWGSVWAEDASWEFPHLPDIGIVRGKQKLLELWRTVGASYGNISISVTPASIVVDGDRATGRAYVSEIYEEPVGQVRHGRPVYRDTYVKRDGEWFIASRVSTPRHYG